MTETSKLLAGLATIALAAFLTWNGKVTAQAWENVTVWTFALLVVERPVVAAFGAMQVSAQAAVAKAQAKAQASA